MGWSFPIQARRLFDHKLTPLKVKVFTRLRALICVGRMPRSWSSTTRTSSKQIPCRSSILWSPTSRTRSRRLSHLSCLPILRGGAVLCQVFASLSVLSTERIVIMKILTERLISPSSAFVMAGGRVPIRGCTSGKEFQCSTHPLLCIFVSGMACVSAGTLVRPPLN